MERIQRAAGAVVGSAVGDALGGPFEFGPQGAFSARFPASGDGGEMRGGGGWDPGEATDDTQMAVLVAESLLEQGGLDLPDIFARFQRWAASDPKDIGLQTEDVLTNGMPWDLAAAIHFQVNQRAAGNGSLMRASTSAVHFAAAGQEATMDAARRIAALTHGDRAAWEGTAIFHDSSASRSRTPTPHRTPGHPRSCPPRPPRPLRHRPRARLAPRSGDRVQRRRLALPGSAVWALRTTNSYEDAIRAAIDLGGDTDTVAAVTGGLAGAYYGLDAIPVHWTQPLHVPLPGFDGRVLHLEDLLHLAHRLEGGR